MAASTPPASGKTTAEEFYRLSPAADWRLELIDSAVIRTWPNSVLMGLTATAPGTAI